MIYCQISTFCIFEPPQPSFGHFSAFQHPFLAPIVFWISSEYFFLYFLILCGNPKTGNNNWEEYLPFVEFAYNRIMHSTTSFSSFKIVY